MSMNLTPTHGRVNVWRMGRPYREVLVRSVSGRLATVKDISNGYETDMPSMTPDGSVPVPGDVWLASVESGQWMFSRMIDPASRRVTSLHERTVDRVGSEWSPYDSPVNASPEVVHGAYLGERRYFEVAPNDRWVKLDGRAISRHRYRDYFDLVGTRYGVGDGLSTFNVDILAGGNAKISAVSKTTSQTGIIASTDITGMSITVVTMTPRKLTVYGETYIQSSVAADSAALRIMDGSGTQLQSGVVSLPIAAAAFKVACSIDVVSVAGSNTYKLNVARNTGTGTLICDAGPGYPTILRVVDDGPNSPGTEGWYVCVE